MAQSSEVIRQAGEVEFTDPLYGICKIDEPFASTLLHPAIQTEKERLQGIKSLGLIFNFFPAANHTKWEHYLGMYSVAKQLKYGLTQEEQRQLQWLCLLGGFGHVPCTYVTASAIFLATMLSNDFKKRLKVFIRPANRICTDCEDREHCLDEPVMSVFDSLYYKALRGSLSAYKLLRLPTEVNIGHRDTLVSGCVCPHNKLYRIYEAISRYDYMQRDLYHTGLARFHISFDEVFRTLTEGIDAFEGTPSMKLLNELYDYLVDSLYLRPDIACCESMLAKVLAAKLCSGEIAIDELIQYDDHSLVQRLQQILGESPIIHVQRRPPIFAVKRDLSIDWFESPNALGLEMELLGIRSTEKNKLQEYPQDYGMILSVYPMGESEEYESTFRVIINVLHGNQRLCPIVAAAFRLQDRMITEAEGSLKLAQEILSYAFGRTTVEYDDSRVRTALQSMVDDLESDEANTIIWEVESILANYETHEGLPPTARRFWRRLQHPSRKRNRSIKSEDLKRFWESMVRCLMSCAYNPNTFSKTLWPIVGRVRNLAQKTTGGNADLIEALAYSTELISARKRQPKWVLPSVKIVSSRDRQDRKRDTLRNEIDVVSITLLPDRVQIKLLECTKSASGSKAMEDYQKLERLKGLLSAQQFQDLEILTEVISSSQVRKDFVSLDELYSRSRV